MRRQNDVHRRPRRRDDLLRRRRHRVWRQRQQQETIHSGKFSSFQPSVEDFSFKRPLGTNATCTSSSLPVRAGTHCFAISHALPRPPGVLYLWVNYKHITFTITYQCNGVGGWGWIRYKKKLKALESFSKVATNIKRPLLSKYWLTFWAHNYGINSKYLQSSNQSK